LTKTKYVKVSPSMTHDEFLSWLDDGDEIIGFNGWVEVIDSMLMEEVPETFLDCETPIIEEYDVEEKYFNEEGEEKTRTVTKERVKVDTNGNAVMRPKTWEEYVGGNFCESVNEGKVLMPIGYRDNRGNLRHVVGDEELRQWITQFNITNVLTKSEGKDLIKIEEGE